MLAPPLPPAARQDAQHADPPGRPFFRRWAFRFGALAAIGASIALDADALVVVPLLFVLVVPFEKMFPRHRGQKVRRPLASLDIRYALTAPLLNIAGITVAVAVGLASLAWIPGLAIRPVVAMLPAAALPFVALALFDMAVYWVHRWMHEVPELWRFHAVHHSTEHLDWISGFRAHPFDGALVAPPFVFLLAAGFDVQVTGALAIIQILVGLFLHANVRWRLRPLHRVVSTPEFHHWHHANERDAHCSNYSGLLPIWDVVFGTYYMPRNRRPLRYGVDDPMPTTMRGQLRYPLRRVRSPWQMFRHPWRTVRSGWATVRRVLRGIRRSTFRPRRRHPKRGEPCNWALTPPVHDARRAPMSRM